MAITKAARSKIFTLVQEIKKLLVLEVASQLQQFYGIRPDGSMLLVEQLPATEPEILHTARLLRQRIDYIKSNIPSEKNKEVEAIKQLSHPLLVSYLWQLMGKKEMCIYIGSDSFEDYIHNKETNEILIKPAIVSILDKLYIDNPTNVVILDKYATIIGVEYNKILSYNKCHNSDIMQHL